MPAAGKVIEQFVIFRLWSALAPRKTPITVRVSNESSRQEPFDYCRAIALMSRKDQTNGFFIEYWRFLLSFFFFGFVWRCLIYLCFIL